MSAVVAALIGAVTGVLSGFGIGGGSLLMLYLTLVCGLPQFQAGGINLLYFIACAPAALVSHIRGGLVEGRGALFAGALGVPAAVACSFAAAQLDISLLRRLFGVLLLYIGIKELLSKEKKE